MESKILYNSEVCHLCDEYIDVGYMAENFQATDLYGKKVEIHRSHPNKAMTLIISLPHLEGNFLDEILALDAMMSHIEVDIFCSLILSPSLAQTPLLANRLKKFKHYYDTQGEYGSLYATQIVDGSLEGMLTKALFLISKDGAIFYMQMPHDLQTPFDLERLRIELNRAYTTYTGVGCHG